MRNVRILPVDKSIQRLNLTNILQQSMPSIEIEGSERSESPNLQARKVKKFTSSKFLQFPRVLQIESGQNSNANLADVMQSIIHQPSFQNSTTSSRTSIPRQNLTNRAFANAAAESRLSIYPQNMGTITNNAREVLKARKQLYMSLDASTISNHHDRLKMVRERQDKKIKERDQQFLK